jgi:5'(3')-deoxyribonucleotidase
MANGTIEFGKENVAKCFQVVKALLSESYEVLITQDEMGNMMLYYNKVAWTDKTFTLISFDEIDLLHNAKEKKEIDE